MSEREAQILPSPDSVVRVGFRFSCERCSRRLAVVVEFNHVATTTTVYNPVCPYCSVRQDAFMAEMTAFGGRLFPGTTPQGPFYVGRN